MYSKSTADIGLTLRSHRQGASCGPQTVQSHDEWVQQSGVQSCSACNEQREAPAASLKRIPAISVLAAQVLLAPWGRRAGLAPCAAKRQGAGEAIVLLLVVAALRRIACSGPWRRHRHRARQATIRCPIPRRSWATRPKWQHSANARLQAGNARTTPRSTTRRLGRATSGKHAAAGRRSVLRCADATATATTAATTTNATTATA